MTASLTLVTMAALLVAFGSSSKRRSTESEMLLLERQTKQLTQANRELQERLRWMEGQYSHSRTLGKQLNEALLKEREKNRQLAQRLNPNGASVSSPSGAE